MRKLAALGFLVVAALARSAQCQTPQLVLETGPGFVNSMAFSPDGQILASSGHDHKTTLWDVSSGHVIRSLAEHQDSAGSVAFSPNGNILAEGSYDKTIKLWRVSDAHELRTLIGHSEAITQVAFSPDGQTLASGSYDMTIKLWRVADGHLLRTLSGHQDAITSIAFSPDGRTLASAAVDQTTRFWTVASGRLLQTLVGHQALSVAFSRNGRMLAAMNADEQIRLWNTSFLPGQPRLQATLDQRGNEGDDCNLFNGHIAFSPDGRTLVAGGCHLRLWDVFSRRELRSLENSSVVTAVAFSRDGHLAIASGFEQTINIWDPSENAKLTLADHRSPICSLAFNSDDGALVARSLNGMIKVWGLPGGQEHLIATNTYAAETRCSVTFSPDSRLLAGANGKVVSIWDAVTGKELQALKGHSAPVRSVAFGPRGRTLESSGMDNAIKFWDLATGKEVGSVQNNTGGSWVVFGPDGRSMASGEHLWDITANTIVARTDFAPAPLSETELSAGLRSFIFSPDGRRLASCDGFWDLATRQLQALKDCADGRIAAFSPDGQMLATVNDFDTPKISIWDTASSQQLRFFFSREYVSALAFSHDGRILAAASDQGRITFWEVSSGRELAMLFLLDKGDWAILDPAGRFDASPRGMQLMHWVVGLKTIALAQLKEQYYEPGLLAKILGRDKEPLHAVKPPYRPRSRVGSHPGAAFRELGLSPGVTAKAPAPGSTQLNLSLTDLGGGIGRVQVFVNGSEYVADARQPRQPSSSRNLSLAVDLAKSHVKPGESNEIRVVTWNKDGYLSSRGFTLEWKPGGARDLTPPEFYAIVVGVSEYSSPELQLRFAAKDAQETALALAMGANRLFGAAHVHMTTLTSPAANGGESATKASLKKAFDEAKKAKPGDLFVVYLAGHGVATQGIYAYPTLEARTLNLSDPKVRLESALSDEELVEWIRNIPALHKVMILDTCAAGALEGKLMEKRGVPGDQVRAIERLKDRTGFFVLMGSAADASSYETSRFGQGLLTYALLKGMKGAALREGGFIDVAALFQEVADDVPELAKDIGGIQQPRIAMPGGSSFDIGQLSAEDRAAIPLATAKPVLLRPLFLNSQLHRDNLHLSEALQKSLRNQRYDGLRGESQPSSIYVDQDDFPGAVSPSGDYAVVDDLVEVTIVLARDGQEFSHFTLEGRVNAIESLSEKITAEINRTLSSKQPNQVREP